jgi:hypothetical protein
MQTTDIINAIDDEIERLRRARTFLMGATEAEGPLKLRGRPKGSTKEKMAHQPIKAKNSNRAMSAEGKARIAAAQKARWAAQRKVAKPTNKPAPAGISRSTKKPVKTGSSKRKTAETGVTPSATALEPTT